MTNTKEFYEQAIAELETYCANEPDAAKRDAADKKIAGYHDTIADAAFNDIVKRTERLETLMADLQAVIDKASNTPSISGAIEKLKGLVTSVSGALKGP